MHSNLETAPGGKPAGDAGSCRADSLAYCDRQIGSLAAEMDRLKSRESTLLLFAGDKGTDRGGRAETASGGARQAPSACRQESGRKSAGRKAFREEIALDRH